jgi:hypothetical protein
MKNYRPVANTSTISKVLERVAVAQIIAHIESERILGKYQSAYRQKHSTETALLSVVSEWRNAVDKGMVVCAVSLDVSGAFDSVEHTILINRLQQAGFAGVALEWLSSYLSERTQMIKCRETTSRPMLLKSGVPQGSILGPCLFNVYMAPLAKCLENKKISHHIYADDILLYHEFFSQESSLAMKFIQDGLDLVDEWMRSNFLLLNAQKTKALLFHGKTSPIVTPLSLRGAEIPVYGNDSLKWLGVNLDSQLTLKEFVNTTCRSSYLHLRTIRHARMSLNKQAAKLLCHSLVLSRVDYCNSLLYGIPMKDCNKLQKVINLAARIVTQKRRCESISPLLNELQWLRAKNRIELKLCSIVFTFLRSGKPEYLERFIEVYEPARNLRSSNSYQLVRHSARVRIGEGSIGVSGPKVWNALPPEMRQIEKWMAIKKLFLAKQQLEDSL